MMGSRLAKYMYTILSVLLLCVRQGPRRRLDNMLEPTNNSLFPVSCRFAHIFHAEDWFRRFSASENFSQRGARRRDPGAARRRLANLICKSRRNKRKLCSSSLNG